jgi:hypothetical protein
MNVCECNHENIPVVMQCIGETRKATFIGERTLLHHQRGARSQSMDLSNASSIACLEDLNSYAPYAEVLDMHSSWYP